MKPHEITSPDNYFEDFAVGDVIRHARGKTVTEMDNVLITNMVMNTAEGHFNEDAMKTEMADIPGFNTRIVFGGVTVSMVIGLAAQDTAEQALEELGMDGIRLLAPVKHGDTLYAYSEVIAADDAPRDDAGVVTFKHYGLNQDDKLVFEGERRVMVKRRSHWAEL
jgi:itaconyl-CoA hydratase